MLSNAYFLAKIRFDTAESEPAKNLQKFANLNSNFANYAITERPPPERTSPALRPYGSSIIGGPMNSMGGCAAAGEAPQPVSLSGAQLSAWVAMSARNSWQIAKI